MKNADNSSPETGSTNCRLLYLVGQLSYGGLERQLCFLLERLDRNCYSPEVVVWSFCEREGFVPRLRELGIPLHPIPRSTSRIAKLIAFRRMIQTIRPEVVHSYSFHTNFAAWWGARGTNTIAVGAVQSDFLFDKESCGRWLGLLSARWPQCQIYNNLKAAQNAKLSPRLFVPQQILVVRNGVDLERFCPLPTESTDKICILGIGSLSPIKRWDRLLVAGLELKRAGHNFLIRIVGDGPLRQSLLAQVQSMGLEQCVEFIGQSDDIPTLLADSTLLAHTSAAEGCPNVVMEAMACGRPVVATDAGDVSSLVDDGKTGYVVEQADDRALVDRIATLIVNREICWQMGAAGRAKAEREFGAKHLVDGTLKAYQAAGWKK